MANRIIDIMNVLMALCFLAGVYIIINQFYRLIKAAADLTAELRKMTETYFPQQHLKDLANDFVPDAGKSRVEIKKSWDEDREPIS